MAQESGAGSSAGGVKAVDVVVVGAGFAGMYMLHRLRGLGMSTAVIEAGDGVGGTWYWNRYPGARCDVESMEYQYGFDDDLARNWRWSERYATQPEILTYANHVADKLDLRRDITFETRVTGAHYNEAQARWTVTTDRGQTYSARFCVMATGCLSASRVPDFKGADSFKGDTYHTGHWPHEGVDFTGKRVGVIGTGSSAIQSIPIMAKQATQLTVFQRTANFSVPAHNAEMVPEQHPLYADRITETRARAKKSMSGILAANVNNKSVFDASEEERRREFDARWERGGFGLGSAFNDLSLTVEANNIVADYVRSKIKEIVKDPETAEILCPKDYPFGTKRLCVDTEYYATFNRPNVKLVDLKKSPIVEIIEKGIRTEDADYEFDAIVFATGFDAMTGALLAMDIRGRGGERLADKWEHGPRTYLGLQIAGFPNLFTVTGPGSPSVLSNMLVSIEQHVEWISDCFEYMAEHGKSTIEATVEAEDAWVDHVNAVASKTLFPLANSWYIGANVPGKPRVFMPYVGGVGNYAERCEKIAASGYEGFALS